MGFIVDLLERFIGKAEEISNDINQRRDKLRCCSDKELIVKVKLTTGTDKIAAITELNSKRKY